MIDFFPPLSHEVQHAVLPIEKQGDSAMIDLFNFGQGSEAGVLPVSIRGSTTHVSLESSFYAGVAVVGPNDPPRPTNLAPTSYLDVVGPDLPPRPK